MRGKGLDWAHILEAMRQASSGEERRVLLVLPDTSFHVSEVLAGSGVGEHLGFVVYADSPELSKRTEETCLLFVRPEQVQRVLIQGYDRDQTLGF